MAYELAYWPAADDALTGPEKDAGLAAVLKAVDRALARLADDPFSPRLGTIPFMTEVLGGINATPARIDDWYVIWQRAPEDGLLDIVAIAKLPL